MAERPSFRDKFDARKFCLVMAFVCFALAAVEFVSPLAAPPTRRMARAVYEVFGSYGIVAFFVIAGVFLLGVGLKRGG
jgi:amino acid permease